MPETREHEVVVLGGGPAGCAAATLLARCGHDVCLVRPEAPPAGRLAESIPPSAGQVLAELGLDAAIAGARPHPNAGNRVWWAGGTSHSETFADGRLGFHTDRADLEKVLGDAARRAGATLRDGATARDAEEGPGGWRVRCAGEGGAAFDLRASWVLDATGRRGVIARREGRVADRSTTTTALVRRWRRAGGFEGVPATHTLVESYPDGWAWSVPLAPDVRCFTAMVDHRFTSLDESDLDATLGAELAKAPHLARLLEGAQALDRAWACPASLYTARSFARPGLLLVGDAASFIDPLSSFGVKKALSSGWLAGVAVHTALTDAAMGDAALRLHDEREREVYAASRAQSAAFFEEAALAYRHPYWETRAEASRGPSGSLGATDAPGASEVAPGDVRAAFERIRSREHLDARRARDARVVDRPTVVGHRVVLERHLASARAPKGIRYVRNVDLVRLVDVAPRHRDVPDGWSAYNAVAPSVTLPDYLTALATAFAAGLLEHDEGAEERPRGRMAAAMGAVS